MYVRQFSTGSVCHRVDGKVAGHHFQLVHYPVLRTREDAGSGGRIEDKVVGCNEELVI